MTEQQEELLTTLLSEKPDINTITALLQTGINLNYGKDGKSPLHYAVLLPKNKKRNQIVKLFLEHGADICIKGERIFSSRDGYLGNISPLEVIIYQGIEELLDICIAHKCQLDVPELLKSFPFEKEKRGTSEFLQKLLSLRTSLTKDEMYDLLRYSIEKHRHNDLLMHLLSLNPDVNYHRGTPLLHQVYLPSLIQVFIAKGADVAAFDKDGYTALHAGSTLKDEDERERIKALVETGKININIESVKGSLTSHNNIEGITPLAQKCRHPHDGMLQTIAYMISQGADVKANADEYGNTPLHYAISGNNTQVVRLLLAKGADIEATNKAGCTPLNYFKGYWNKEAIQVLLENGANVNSTNKYGENTIHRACSCISTTSSQNGHEITGTIDLIKLFQSYGVDHCAKNKEGKTPVELIENENTRALVANSL